MLNSDSDMVKGEARYRFDQNLRLEDRNNKLGNYYVIEWNEDAINLNGMSLSLKFHYRQASTGRVIQTKSFTLPPKSEPEFEIAIIGEEYKNNGRVLAWKATLMQGEETIGTEQSFLWE